MSEIKTAEQRIHKLEGGEGDSFVTFEQALIAERDELRAALKERDAEIEQLHVQLAGCGVAAMQNTEASKADRATPGGYGWSESYGDVCRAVDREIELRAKLAALKKQEPVAHVVVEPDYWSGGHFYAGSKPYIRYTELRELRIGDKLYTAAGAAPVPEGWQLVPIEPTPEMCEVSTWDYNRFYPAKEIYKAMLAAAPVCAQRFSN